MRSLFHILSKNSWEAAQALGVYVADSLESEGFIHFSRPHQVLRVADFLFQGRKGLLLLHVSQERLKAPLKYEGVDGDVFPHLYGPLNLDAVVGVHAFDDTSCLPAGFALVGDTLIRRGCPGDEAELASVHTHSWQQSYKGLLPDAVLAERPLGFRARLTWWKEVVAGATATTVFVAESAKHGLVGFCAVEPARDEDFKGYGEISAIYCLNEYKGKGIGAELFRRGCDSLRSQGFSSFYLWVLKGNPTIEFYKRMGGVVLSLSKPLELGAPLTEIAVEWKNGR